MAHHPLVLDKFGVNAKDRTYQFWERNPLSIDLYTHIVFMQKLENIHWNPIRAGICNLPAAYYFSSAKFYHSGLRKWHLIIDLKAEHQQSKKSTYC